MRLFIVSRVRRVVFPYFIWGMFASLILLLRDSNVSYIKDILLADNVSQLPFCNQLWFIKPYLAVSIIGYLLLTAIYKFKESKTFSQMISGGKSLIYSLMAVCLALLPFLGNTFAYIVAYLYFFIMGFLYKRWTHSDFMICILLIIPLYLLVRYGIYDFVMQDNKFPPNLYFVLYGTVAVALVVELSKTKIAKIIQDISIINKWNKYGYEVYLYQNYAFWITWIFMERLSQVYVLPKTGHYTISMVTIVLLLSIVAPQIHRFNNYILSKLPIL